MPYFTPSSDFSIHQYSELEAIGYTVFLGRFFLKRCEASTRMDGGKKRERGTKVEVAYIIVYIFYSGVRGPERAGSK